MANTRTVDLTDNSFTLIATDTTGEVFNKYPQKYSVFVIEAASAPIFNSANRRVSIPLGDSKIFVLSGGQSLYGYAQLNDNLADVFVSVAEE